MPRAPGNTIRPMLLFQRPIQAQRADAAVPFVPIADLMSCGISGQAGTSRLQKAWPDKRFGWPAWSRKHGTRDALLLRGAGIPAPAKRRCCDGMPAMPRSHSSGSFH